MPAITKHTPGMLCWTDLTAKDSRAAKRFYTELFHFKVETFPHFKVETFPHFAGPHVVFKESGHSVCGMMTMSKNTPKGTPSQWIVYFAVESCDATVKKAKKLGANIVVPPTDIPDVGRLAMMFDPQGAFFAVLQPAPK